jgi:hypothetical protein
MLQGNVEFRLFLSLLSVWTVVVTEDFLAKLGTNYNFAKDR